MTTIFGKVLAGAALGLAVTAGSALAAGDGGHGPAIQRQHWSFAGVRGRFDKVQLQRGFQVYKEVCSSCHGLKRINWRNLAEPGGPGFPEESVKAEAAAWPNKIFDGPNDNGDIADRRGRIIKRPALLSDPILGPYDNDKQARAGQNGALPPDLSLITKARGVEFTGAIWAQPLHMLRDMVNGYQEGGADYVYALLTGYGNVPADMKNPDGTPFKLADGMNYNSAFPGHQIAMAQPLNAGAVKYQDGSPATVEQYAKDVVAFLAWAGDPKLEERKSLGLSVLLYLLVTTILLYFAKRKLWSGLH